MKTYTILFPLIVFLDIERQKRKLKDTQKIN